MIAEAPKNQEHQLENKQMNTLELPNHFQSTGQNEQTENRISSVARWRQFSAAIAACFGAFISGIMVSWTSPAYESLVTKSSMGFEISEDDFVKIGFVMPLGASITCMFAWCIVNLWGRKTYLQLMTIPYLISWSLLIWATNANTLILARFIGGLGSGAFCAVAPAYITEITEKNIRGALSSLYTLLFISGIFYSYAVGAFVTLETLNVTGLVYTIVYGVWICFQPETPVYYIKLEKLEKARQILSYFRGNDCDVSEEFEAMKVREARRVTQTTFTKCFERKAVQRAVTICFALQLFQQVSGIEALLFYQKSIMEASHLSFSTDLATIIVGGVHLFFTVLATLFVDRLGRKFLLLISGMIISLCCGVLAVYYSLDPETCESYSLVPVIALGTFRGVFALGYGPVPWIIVAEILTEELKNTMSSLTAVIGWGLSAVCTVVFPYAVSYFGMAPTFLFFGVGSLLSVVYVGMCVPETKKKSLDEIQEILEDGCTKKSFKVARAKSSDAN